MVQVKQMIHIKKQINKRPTLNCNSLAKTEKKTYQECKVQSYWIRIYLVRCTSHDARVTVM